MNVCDTLARNAGLALAWHQDSASGRLLQQPTDKLIMRSKMYLTHQLISNNDRLSPVTFVANAVTEQCNRSTDSLLMSRILPAVSCLVWTVMSLCSLS